MFGKRFSSSFPVVRKCKVRLEVNSIRCPALARSIRPTTMRRGESVGIDAGSRVHIASSLRRGRHNTDYQSISVTHLHRTIRPPAADERLSAVTHGVRRILELIVLINPSAVRMEWPSACHVSSNNRPTFHRCHFSDGAVLVSIASIISIVNYCQCFYV